MDNNRTLTYEKLLAELEAEKEELEKEIDIIKKRLGRSETTSSASSITASDKTVLGQIHHDTFYGMSVVDATKKYLSMVGKPARHTQEVIDALKKGGIDKEYQTVSAVLARAARKRQGLDKVGRGNWGLSEWYPNTGRKSVKSDHDENNDDIG